MDYKKLVVAAVVLAAVGSATVIDGIGGLGLGDNVVRTALWRNQKRIDAGVTVKSDKTVITEGGKSEGRDQISTFPNAPWVSWTDSLGKGFYQVGLGLEAWKNYDTDVNNTALNFEYAQDVGGIIAGVGIGYQSLSAKDNVSKVTTTSSPLTLSLGLAKVLDSRQTVLLGYKTGANITESKKASGAKAVETEKIQNTDIAIGYVYAVNNALQLGVQLINTWSWYSDPTKTFGLAASYLAAKDLEIQGYLNLTNGVGGVHNDDKGWDVTGEDHTTYGINVLYDLAKFGNIGAGVEVTSYIDKGDVLDDHQKGGKNVTGTLFYTYLF